MAQYKTFIVNEAATEVHGTTPRHATLGLTREIYWGNETKFVPLQRIATSDACTTLTKDTVQMQMWVLSETPRMAQLFGKGSAPEVALPEEVNLQYATSETGAWSERMTAIMGTNLVLPKFDVYPMLVKFEAQLKK